MVSSGELTLITSQPAPLDRRVSDSDHDGEAAASVEFSQVTLVKWFTHAMSPLPSLSAAVCCVWLCLSLLWHLLWCGDPDLGFRLSSCERPFLNKAVCGEVTLFFV